MLKVIWQKFLKITSSAVALAVFTLLAYAEVFVFVSGSFHIPQMNIVVRLKIQERYLIMVNIWVD